MNDIKNLVRQNIKALKPYSSARNDFKNKAEIFLDANENPYNKLKYNRYPDPLQKELKIKLAKLKNVKPENIFCGNGSDEAIDILLRVFCEPNKDKIIILPPTYGIYEVYANIASVDIIKIPLINKELTKNNDFALNINVILEQADKNIKLLFINNPNNPTGTYFKQKDIELLIKKFKGIVILDEAYIDFSSKPSCINLIKKYNNLIILQTLSKAFGLAGLRIGTAYANNEIIDLMNNVKSPYNVNLFTQQQALKVLNNFDYYNKNLIPEIINNRNLLINEFKKFKFIKDIFPTETNFILIKVDNAKKLYDYLITKKIVVRNRSNEMYCENSLRISVGTNAENKKLIKALNEFNNL